MKRPCELARDRRHVDDYMSEKKKQKQGEWSEQNNLLTKEENMVKI